MHTVASGRPRKVNLGSAETEMEKSRDLGRDRDFTSMEIWIYSSATYDFSKVTPFLASFSIKHFAG